MHIILYTISALALLFGLFTSQFVQSAMHETNVILIYLIAGLAFIGGVLSDLLLKIEKHLSRIAGPVSTSGGQEKVAN